jgi:excisionase family DNA binding protein
VPRTGTPASRASAPPYRPEPNATLALTLPAELVEQIAQRAAAIVAERQTPAASPWLDTKGAAGYLACGTDRIHDLVQLGKLHPRRDGRRLLFRRDDLDAYLEASP